MGNIWICPSSVLCYEKETMLPGYQKTSTVNRSFYTKRKQPTRQAQWKQQHLNAKYRLCLHNIKSINRRVKNSTCTNVLSILPNWCVCFRFVTGVNNCFGIV